MCGRVGFSSREDLEEYLDNNDQKLDGVEPRYNASPFQKYPVIQQDGKKTLSMLRWGYKPVWSNSPLINAKEEKLMSTKTYTEAFLTRRAVIPANFYYEWTKLPDGTKQPYLFKKKDGGLFLIPAFIMTIEDKGEKMDVFITITTEPNKLVAKVHPRATVMFDIGKEDTWLNPDIVEPEPLLDQLHPYPAEKMDMYAVSQKLNSYKNDYEDLIKPIEDPLGISTIAATA